MAFTYRPILRSKSGEAHALRHLSAGAKQRIAPLITLLETPPATFGTVVGNAWNAHPLGLNGELNSAGFLAMFDTLGNAGVQVMPAVSIQSPTAYLSLAKNVVGKYAPGVVVLASLANLSNAAGWVASQGWQQNGVDLVIELGDITALPLSSFRPYVLHELTTAIGPQSSWRSVTLVASSAPQDYSALPPGRTDVPRLEWLLWSQLQGNLSFQLDFGDTGHIHPSLAEPPGFAMARATVSARYTVDDNWIVLKGKQTSGASGQPMAKQFLGHAKTLANDAAFDALPQCWADDHIKAIAATTATPGNRTTWATIAMNRHLEFIAHHLP